MTYKRGSRERVFVEDDISLSVMVAHEEEGRWICCWPSDLGLSVGFLCRGAGASPLHPRDWPAVSGAALSALTRTGRCKKVYGSYWKISLIHKGFFDCKPSCATARVRGLSPLRHRPPFALREGGFAPFTPATEEIQQPDKPQFLTPTHSIPRYSPQIP